MDYKKQLSGKWILAAWLGFGLVLVMALTLGEGIPVVVLVGAMALTSTFAYATLGRGPRTANG